MRFQQTVASLALVASAAAAPAQAKRDIRVTGAKKFTFNQVPAATPGKITAGPIVYANALRKYSRLGATVPQNVTAAASRAAATDDGSVAANPEQYDSAYLEQVKIGSQTFSLDFDSGSSDLWVFSNELSASSQSGHDIYTPGSTAKKVSGATWQISYGDGSSASGNVYTDTVSVGQTTVKGQAVELASTVSSEFAQQPGDGLLGLAFDSINTVKPKPVKTFFDNAMSNLEQPLFAADLKKGQPGTYDFGFIDTSKYTGQIAYTPVDNSQGFWSFTADGYTVENGPSSNTQLTGIADTGTSLLLLDNDTVAAYWDTVPSATNDESQGGFTIPCSTTLPDFTVTIAGTDFTVPGSYLNYAPTDSSGETCFGGLQTSGSLGFGIFGDIFLKAVYVVFDSQGPQLGFANKNLASAGSVATS